MTPREAWRRLCGALGSGPADRDLSEELRFHRDMLEAQYRAQGLRDVDARRAARVALGGEAQLAERWRDQRSLPFLDTLGQDVRYALRVLRRNPGFTASALVTLALGIGANTAIFSIVDAVLVRPLPYADPDRLVTVGDRNAPGYSSNVGFATMVDLGARSRTFESFAMMRSWQPTLVSRGEAERLPAVRVSWNYFDMLGVRPALGRGFTADEDRPDHWRVVLLSDGLWRRRFGADPSIVGRTVTLNDSDFRVVGIMPPSFEPLAARRYYNADAVIWAPIGYDIHGDSSCRSCQHLRGFGRIRPGVTLAQAGAEMDAIREQMRREHPTDYEPGSMATVPLRDALTNNVRTALLVLLAAVAFVLLIACANVASLLLARSLTRQRELALRAALGAGRSRITRQLLTESVMLSLAGAAGGIGLALIAVRALGTLAPVSLPRAEHITIDARILAFTVLLSLVTSAIFGLVPAWRGAAAGAGGAGRVQGALAIDSRTSTGRTPRARGVLVVLDLVFALVLLTGAGVMLRTVVALTHANPGFEPRGLLSFAFSLAGQAYAEDSATLAFQDRALDTLRAIPGVAAAALSDQIPFGTDYDCRAFHAQGRTKANTVDDPCVERYGITPDYLRVMEIPLLSGRPFSGADTAASQPVLLVSQTTARTIWGHDDPLGAQVRIGSATRGPWRTVVGVVGEVHHDDVTAAPELAMYTPQSQITGSYLVAVVKSGGPDPATLAAPARDAVRRLDATVPVYDVATVTSLIGKAAAQRLFVMRLLGGFAVVAVLLAAVGLYGVVSYGVSQRTREVGLRVALGAQRRDVARLVLGSGLSLVGAGIATGLALSALATRYLGALVFGVSPTDPLTFAAASALLMTVGLLAHLLPVRRALRVDPASALRSE